MVPCEATEIKETAVSRLGTKRYAAVGTGSRVSMYIDPLAHDYKYDGQLVGLCDVSQTRMNYHRDRLMRDYGYHEVPTYHAADFELMVRETKPDVVVVCTIDVTHHEYIIKALQLGCDVVTEKPMTTDEDKCGAILAAVAESGRNLRVTFNYRWSPGALRVRELIAQGAIGDVKAVNLEYQLNTDHGADYFRRWHANKASSGGLLVHKSTHHFDLVNWWIDAIPEEVFAYGDLKFYGRQNALARGDEKYTSYQRYSGSEQAQRDPFALHMDEEADKALYLNAEAESGYIRDRNVFRDGIDIEDTMAVLVRYRTGALLNYSLVAYSPHEGFRVTFTGDRGRIEYTESHSAHVLPDINASGARRFKADESDHHMHLRLIPHFAPGRDIPIIRAEGGHGGGDPQIQRQIFSSTPPHEEWGRNAGHEQGAASILIGTAANRSIATGQPVRIDELCSLRPDATRLGQLI